jgi:N-acetylmuramoyl-L-alanine amidase
MFHFHANAKPATQETTKGWRRVLRVPSLFGKAPGFAPILAVSLAFLVVPEARAVVFPALRNGEVNFRGGTFADTTFEDVAYVSGEFLGDLFANAPRWEPSAQQLRVKDTKGREWSFTLDNPFMAVQGEVFNLTYPVRRGPERIYIPLHPLLRVLRTRFDIDLKVPGAPRDGGPVKATPPPAPVEEGASASSVAAGRIAGLTVEETSGGAVLHIRAGEGIQWQGIAAKPHYIVRAFGGTLDAGIPRRTEGAGALQSVEARQQGNTAQFTLRLRGADSVELAEEEGGWRVLVRSPAVDAGSARGTIIVDAGHGGTDPGAMVKGVRETDVNLAVAKQLKIALEERGYKVLLTREDDTFKTLPERPKFASDNKGELFVSLHCNSIAGTASKLATVTGHVAYILREAESEEDKAIARRENVAIEEQGGKGKKTEISPLDWILLEHQLNQYSKQSEALAESIVRNFSGFEIPKYTTGARQAGFFVLVGAYMPAVLFEMGFLTHARDRATLASRDGQKEIARRLALAIDGFQRSRGTK